MRLARLRRTVGLLLLALLSCLPFTRASGSLPSADDLDGVLLRNVRDGFVDYDGIRADPAFARFVASLGNTDPGDLADRNARLAFLINAYNVLAIQGVLDGYSPTTFFGRRTFFKGREYQVLGQPTTLKDLEDELLALGDPRVHFAIVCASLSCPRLHNRAYRPDRIDKQLDEAARRFINDGTRNRFDEARKLAFLSKLFDWYRKDFAREAGSVQQYLARYAADPKVAALLATDGFDTRFLDYDWALNGIFRRPPN
jgi:hypothetical protein